MLSQNNSILLKELSVKTEQILKELIGNNRVVLLDVPYHVNIGDTLIWEGARQCLKRLKIECLATFSKDDVCWNKIPKDAVILCNGGGNFGDLWRSAQAFRLEVLSRYPNNRVVFMPQSVCYKSQDLLKEDCKLIAKHSDCWVLVRDRQSFSMLESYIPKQLLLVPDMAFSIDPNTLTSYKLAEKNEVLFLKRIDKEFQNGDYSIVQQLDLPIVESDWPTMNKKRSLITELLVLFIRILRKLHLKRFLPFYINKIFRPYLIKEGVKLVSKSKEVYTTRLHTCLLAFILGKKVYVFDNSYGKNRAVVQTWLSQADNVFFEEID